MSYPIPSAFYCAEYEIKKSRFIAWVDYAQDRQAAMAVVERARAQYADARHHCWAYLLGDPHNAASAAMSDDGEPSGTAGKPILNVLQHKGVGDVVLVVSRYFGGIKLGAGGLVRAYSTAAQQAMEGLSICERVAMTECQLLCDFSQEQFVRHWLELAGGMVQQITYAGRVTMTLLLPDSECGALATMAAQRGWTLLDMA